MAYISGDYGMIIRQILDASEKKPDIISLCPSKAHEKPSDFRSGKPAFNRV